MGTTSGGEGLKIGLIARADYTGLGIQTYDFWRHMQPAKTLVIDLGHLNGQVTDASKYPGASVLKYTPYPDTRQHHPEAVAAFNEFLHDIDLVFTCETPYDYYLFTEARNRGIKTVLQYNFELLDHVREPDLPRPDLFLAPSLWRYQDLKFDNKEFLPVPVDRQQFPFRKRTEAKTFVHVVGNPAMEDRNGTNLVLEAWNHVRSDVQLKIFTQRPIYQSRDRRVSISSHAVPDPSVFYEAGDVFVLPRRFGGLCLPLNEALSSGMPIIMTELSPQERFLDERMLVPAWSTHNVMAKMPIDVYDSDPVEIARRVDLLAENPDLVEELSAKSGMLGTILSWDEMKRWYDDTLAWVVDGRRRRLEGWGW